MRLLLLLGALLPVPLPAVEAVVHPSVPDGEVSRSTLLAIFSMRLRSWSDGSPIRVYVLQEDAQLHKEFCKQVLGVFPYQMRRIWNRRLYSGTGERPEEIGSIEEMHRLVASTPGAIGYMNEAQEGDDVRMLPIH